LLNFIKRYFLFNLLTYNLSGLINKTQSQDFNFFVNVSALEGGQDKFANVIFETILDSLSVSGSLNRPQLCAQISKKISLLFKNNKISFDKNIFPPTEFWPEQQRHELSVAEARF
jgi:hypothetical protein